VSPLFLGLVSIKHPANKSIGSQRQPQCRILDHHFIPRYPGHLAANMGVLLGHAGTQTNLHLLLLCVHSRQYCPQLLTELCSALDF
jgi:hypothetical protein